jgi:hypothetical protein
MKRFAESGSWCLGFGAWDLSRQYLKERNNFVKFVVVRFRGFGYSILLICLLACESHEAVPARTGAEFVPMRVGAYWEYALTETTISPVNGQVNTLTELRVEVLDSAVNDDEITYVLGRWTRDQGATDWVVTETWSVRQNEFRWIVQQGNVPYVKLSFPLTEGKGWDGNMLNSLGGTEQCADGTDGCDIYTVNNLQKPFEITGTLSFDDTVTIVESDEEDPIIGKDIRKAVYAEGVGLVYLDVTVFEYCTVGSCIGQQVVENGYILKQQLSAHGAD